MTFHPLKSIAYFVCLLSYLYMHYLEIQLFHWYCFSLEHIFGTLSTVTYQWLCCRVIMELAALSMSWGIATAFNILRPRQNGHRFAKCIFKRIFLNENVRISIKISLKFVPKGPINNNPALVQIMAWRRSGDKPLSEAMIVYWRIYASLDLNELSICAIENALGFSAKQHKYFKPHDRFK